MQAAHERRGQRASSASRRSGPTARSQTFTADRYVLAASPIEDARLLLAVGSGRRRLGNSSGLVGRNLMFHYRRSRSASSTSASTAIAAAPSTHGFTDFRGVPGDPESPARRHRRDQRRRRADRRGAVYAQIVNVLRLDGARFKALMRQSPVRDRVASCW